MRSPATSQNGSQAVALSKPEFERGLSCRTIEEAIAAPTIAMAKTSLGYEVVAATVALAVTKAMGYFAANRRLSTEQVMLFAEELLDQYPHESLGDVTVFLRNAAKGRYGRRGEEGETFGQLDMQRLFIWFGQYLEEKALVRERGEHELNQQAEKEAHSVIGMIPGLSEAMAEHIAATSMEEGPSVRLRRLSNHLPLMTDDQLREAWGKHPGAEERSVIYAEARRRGLAQKRIEDHLNQNSDEK